MPSPFPGMDPYLEDPDLWESFHSRLIGALDNLLAARVPPQFYVERQLSVSDLPEETPRRALEVRAGKTDVVTAVIEVLSPASKNPVDARRAAFLDRRRAVMASPVHWLEIDLLRAGERPAEVAGQSDYYVLLKRGHRDGCVVWFASLRDPLPVVAVPLTDGFPDVPLDLQAALTAVYDRHYAGRLDYAGPPPPPPLPPADAAWAEARVRAWRAGGSESASGK